MLPVPIAKLLLFIFNSPCLSSLVPPFSCSSHVFSSGVNRAPPAARQRHFTSSPSVEAFSGSVPRGSGWRTGCRLPRLLSVTRLMDGPPWSSSAAAARPPPRLMARKEGAEVPLRGRLLRFLPPAPRARHGCQGLGGGSAWHLQRLSPRNLGPSNSGDLGVEGMAAGEH